MTENSPKRLSLWRLIAIEGLSEVSDIVLNDVKLTDALQSETGHLSPLVGIGTGDDRVVVSVRWSGPLATGVTLARGLASDEVLAHVERYCERHDRNPVDSDASTRLQTTRCLGFLPTEVPGLEGYFDAIRAEREALVPLAGEDRSEALRRAHGLAGTIIHLLDILDIEPMRELRLPDYLANTHTDGDGSRRRSALLDFLATAVPISSRLGEISAYRLLYEADEDRREQLPGRPLSVNGIPEGTHIGSWILTGHGTSRLLDPLATRLRQPRPAQTDGANFKRTLLPLIISTERQMPAFNGVVSAFCELNSSDFDDQVPRLLAMLTQEPYLAARALRELLGTKSDSISVMDCLQALRAARQELILPDATSTQSAIVHTLLAAQTPLSQAEIARRADVSTQSIRDVRDPLLDFDIIRWTDNGFILSFYDTEPPKFIQRDTLVEVLKHGPLPASIDQWPTETPITESIGLAATINESGYPTIYARLVPAISAWFRFFQCRYDQGELREPGSRRVDAGVPPLIASGELIV